MRVFSLILTLAVFLVSCSEHGSTGQELISKDAAPAHTKPTFNGYEQVAQALASAKKTKQNILLYFGNRGAFYFESLNTVFQKNKTARKMLEANYVMVIIDWTKVQDDKVDEGFRVRRPWGAPWVVILDADGNRLTTLDTSELEEGDGHSPKKILAFLERWKSQNQ